MSSILQGAREALGIAMGEMNPDEYNVHVADGIDEIDPGDVSGEHGSDSGPALSSGPMSTSRHRGA